MPSSGPLILSIETSNPTAHDGAAGVALVREVGGDLELIGSAVLRPERRHDDPLMPEIDRMLRESGHSPSELDRVAVSVGPGGYTSTRIAVTTAKVICMFSGARAVPVPTEFGVMESLGHEAIGPVSVCLAWKRDEVWVRTFAASAPRTDAPPGIIVELQSLGEDRFGMIVCDATLRECLEPLDTIEARFDPLALARAGIGIEAVDPLELAVFYPREPEAVRNWRALGR